MFEDARPDDLPAIQSAIAAFRLDGENLQAGQFLVVREQGAIVAFGRIKPYAGGIFELGSVAVMAAARGRGLGAAMVRELIRRFPTPDVWITTDLHDFFARLGFAAAVEVPPALQGKLERVCATLRANVIAMHLRRPG